MLDILKISLIEACSMHWQRRLYETTRRTPVISQHPAPASKMFKTSSIRTDLPRPSCEVR